jgi:hypothetical protein
MIMKSELNARNKITATGALAVPVLRYSFGIITLESRFIDLTFFVFKYLSFTIFAPEESSI